MATATDDNAEIRNLDVRLFKKSTCWHTSIVIFENTKYKRIVRLSLSIPTFDLGDREYDSWHDFFLLQEYNGIIRAVYCTGGYRIARIEGYAQVYQYPESLEKYFRV